ncbi:MAG TPA: glycosyltransferase [Patescibacteria group bacterium]|nr:glycosyltransferase [Patescibacteria group bacterium]
MKKVKTVTIGIPAHNEENNIARLLRDILLQEGNNFKLDRIIVVCDGCTDGTADIVNKISAKNKLVKLINDKKRIGKNSRLNQLYKDLRSDIFIAFDADVELRNKNVIKNLVEKFNDEKVGLVGGRVKHISRKTFIGRAMLAQEYFWSRVVLNINKGNNLQGHTGPVSAARRDFIENIKIPSNLPDDHFLFLKAIEKNYKYVYAKNASVYVKVPSTFNDFINQRTRFLDAGDNVRKYFGKKVDRYYSIPYIVKAVAYFQAFIKYPFFLPLSLGLISLQKIMMGHYSQYKNRDLWIQVRSSK